MKCPPTGGHYALRLLFPKNLCFATISYFSKQNPRGNFPRGAFFNKTSALAELFDVAALFQRDLAVGGGDEQAQKDDIRAERLVGFGENAN